MSRKRDRGELAAPVAGGTFKRATVTSVAPLRIRFVGKTEDHQIAPMTLVKPADLAVNAQVWVQIYGKNLLLVGRIWT